jgi:predicted DNA-binding protein
MSDNRGLKTRKAFSNSLDKELFKELKSLSEDTKIPMSKLLDEAVELLIEKHKPAK